MCVSACLAVSRCTVCCAEWGSGYTRIVAHTTQENKNYALHYKQGSDPDIECSCSTISGSCKNTICEFLEKILLEINFLASQKSGPVIYTCYMV